jgi:leucyl aminopeptidase
MDITDHQDLGLENAFRATTKKHKTVVFPKKSEFQKDVRPLLKKLEKENMKANLEKFTAFHTRYYKVPNPPSPPPP